MIAASSCRSSRRGAARSRGIACGRGAPQARRRSRAKLGLGTVVGRLHGGADPGGAFQRHRRRRHRRGRSFCLRRKQFEPGLSVLADRGGAERRAGALPLHEDDWGEPDPAASAKRAKELADEGAIDPIAGLAADNVYLFSGNEDQTVTRPVVKAAALLQGSRRRSRQYHPHRERGRPRLPHRAGRRGMRHLGHALCQRLRLQPGRSHPRLDLWPARRPPRPSLPAASSCSTKATFPSRATGSPMRAWSMSRRTAPIGPAAGSISRCMAASSRARRSAILSSRTPASPKSPTRTGSSSSSRRRRRARSTPWLLGLVGLYRARLSRQGCAPDQGNLGHGRATGRGAMRLA